MSQTERVVAVGLLTERDLEVLGIGFKRLFPLTGSGEFDALLRAIDLADRAQSDDRPQIDP